MRIVVVSYQTFKSSFFQEFLPLPAEQNFEQKYSESGDLVRWHLVIEQIGFGIIMPGDRLTSCKFKWYFSS